MEETHLLCEPISRPGEPTSAGPGTARKVRVLMERAARREALFHPLDGIRHLQPNEPLEPIEMLPPQETSIAG